MTTAPLQQPGVSALSQDDPWPGLLAFREEDSGFFLGREKEAEQLLALVQRSSVTVLYGQSGLGKTSLIRAGLFPKLRQNNFFPLWLRLNPDANALPLAERTKQAITVAIQETG